MDADGLAGAVAGWGYDPQIPGLGGGRPPSPVPVRYDGDEEPCPPGGATWDCLVKEVREMVREYPLGVRPSEVAKRLRAFRNVKWIAVDSRMLRAAMDQLTEHGCMSRSRGGPNF